MRKGCGYPERKPAFGLGGCRCWQRFEVGYWGHLGERVGVAWGQWMYWRAVPFYGGGVGGSRGQGYKGFECS